MPECPRLEPTRSPHADHRAASFLWLEDGEAECREANTPERRGPDAQVAAPGPAGLCLLSQLRSTPPPVTQSSCWVGATALALGAKGPPLPGVEPHRGAGPGTKAD